MATSKYRLAEGAQADLREIAQFIGKENSDAVSRVIEEFFRTFELLSTNPESGTSLNHLRTGLKMFMPAKPAARYVVFYYVERTQILITAVLHSARDWIGMFVIGER